MFDHCLMLAVNLARASQRHRRVDPDDHTLFSAGDAILIAKADAARGQDFGEQATTVRDLVAGLVRLEGEKLAIGEFAHALSGRVNGTYCPPSSRTYSVVGAGS